MKDNENDPHRYDDIMNLPHHVSKGHLPMPIINRAAQFAPFAALSGYEEAVSETARLTEEKVELDENCKEILDEKLHMIKEHLQDPLKECAVKVTYFEPDEKKAGGEYLTVSGAVRKIDSYEQTLIMQDGKKIRIEYIINIEINNAAAEEES